MEQLKNIVMQDAKETGDEMTYLEDLTQNGCASGMVSRLIYVGDCQDFYDAYYEEIEELVQDFQDMTGDHPLQHNTRQLDTKNFLAWFAYEETANRLLAEMEDE